MSSANEQTQTKVTVADVSVSAYGEPAEVLKLLQKACELQRKSRRHEHDLVMKERGFVPPPPKRQATASKPPATAAAAADSKVVGTSGSK
mgnify:CR=1 FL=1